MKKIFGIILVIIIIGVIWFVRATRPVEQPTANNNVETAVERVDTATTTGNTYRISSGSKAQFSLNELLRGKPVLVVGATDQIAGDITVTSMNPAVMTIGELKIDARTLKTDSRDRDGAIARMILKSSESGNEYITFKPTNVSDLPASIELGKEYAYKITGDLTVRGVTKSVTFNAKSVLKDANTLTGSADTTITYGDFGISVPDLPFLANVDKTTKLSVSIVATVK